MQFRLYISMQAQKLQSNIDGIAIVGEMDPIYIFDIFSVQHNLDIVRNKMN